MSSWLVSLRLVGPCVGRARRGLKKGRLGASWFRDRALKVAPGRLTAEAQSQISEQGRNLAIVHAGGKARHDRTALALDGSHAREHDVGEVARIAGTDRGAEAEMDAAIGRRPVAVMTTGAGGDVDFAAFGFRWRARALPGLREHGLQLA